MEWFSGEQHEPFEIQAGPNAMLLVHGFMGTPAELRPVAHALADSGISVRGIQLPGFGRDIARLGQVTRSDWIRATVDAWDDLARRHARVGLLGYSMGGGVALHVAARRPISELILVAPLWKLVSGSRRSLLMPFLPIVKRVIHEVRPFAGTDFNNPDVRQFLAEMMPSANLDDPETRQALRSEAILPTATLDEMRRLSAEAGDLARRVSTPTLVIQGMQDHVVTAKDTRNLVARFSCPVAFHQIPGDHLLLADDRASWPAIRDIVVSSAARSVPLTAKAR